jgi:hypothetical protein
MENWLGFFPRYGKLFAGFSTLWKTFLIFFHAMEKCFDFFPRHGKSPRDFSTPWKTFFHTVENTPPASAGRMP